MRWKLNLLAAAAAVGLVAAAAGTGPVVEHLDGPGLPKQYSGEHQHLRVRSVFVLPRL